MQKKGFVGTFIRSFGRLFRFRNIIVISEHKIEHYPISTRVQFGLIAVGLVAICGVSYSTGSYMAAKSILREKDQKIFHASLENQRIGQEITMLKHDLLKLNDVQGDSKAMSDYTKFIIDQYAKEDAGKPKEEPRGFSAFSFSSLGDESGNGTDKVMARIEFLEKRIDELQAKNRQMVDTLMEKTEGKISDLEEVIRMTGLGSDSLVRQARKEREHHTNTKSRFGSWLSGEGGPFIPADPINYEYKEEALFRKVDTLMDLNHVVETLPLSEPIRNGQMMSSFGRRVDPFTKRWALHSGLDIAGPYHAPIYATNDGKVSFAGTKGAYGQMVEIEHPYGVATRYGHLARILVKEGQEIKRGDRIGLQGTTGRSTGPHVHYEVRVNDRPLNPVKFIEAGKHVF